MKLWPIPPRTRLALFVLLVAVWCLWHPRRMDALFSAIPHDAAVVSCHVGLAAEWKALVRNETFLQVLERAGVSDARDLADNAGVYATMYWLTGRYTVVGFVPDAWSGDPRDGHLAGASHVGWKAKPMELLWRLKWIPGLGRMETTPTGTRYIRFKGLVDAMGRDLLLGLDIVDGMLLATLSTDPETVRELADRVMIGVPDNHLAAAYGASRPWEMDLRGVRHAVWATDSRILDGAPLVFTTGSLRGPGFQFTLRGKLAGSTLASLRPFSDSGDRPSPGMGLSTEAVPLLVVFDASAIDRLGPSAPPAGPGLAAVYLGGKPFEGRIMGLAYPSINAVLPWSPDEDFKAWSGAWIETARRDFEDAKLRTEWAERPYVQTRFVFSSHLEFLGRAKPEDMAFLELDDGYFLNIGSHYGSFRRRGASRVQNGDPSLAGLADAWRRAHPAAFAAGRADMAALHGELKHLGAIAKLAGSLAGGRDGAAAASTADAAEATFAAMAPLGVVEFVAFAEPDGWLKLDVRAQGAAAR